MKNIELKCSDYNYAGSEYIESNNVSNYTFHHLAVFKDLIIGDKKFCANYSTGNTFYHNDFSLPKNELTLEDGDSFIFEISNMSEDDIGVEELKYLHDEFNATFIETVEELRDINTLINECQESEYSYINDDEIFFLCAVCDKKFKSIEEVQKCEKNHDDDK